MKCSCGVRRENENVRFARTDIVIVNVRSVSKLLNQFVLQRNSRVQIFERVAAKLENELVSHGACEVV
jgi:hypothetical protein